MNVNRKRNWVRVVLQLAVVGVLGTSLAYAEAPPAAGTRSKDRAHEDGAPQAQNISGVVDGYNYSPRGTINSVVIKDGEHVSQLNLPPDMGAAVAAVAPVGQSIGASGMP